MAIRKIGGIVIISAISAYGVAPYYSISVASSSYLLSIGESLHYELKPQGIDVTVLLPGPTRAPLMLESKDWDFSKAKLPWMEVGPVVDIALKALGEKATVVPGKINRISVFMFKHILSRKRIASMVGNSFRSVLRKELL